jgi:hypothetical protein
VSHITINGDSRHHHGHCDGGIADDGLPVFANVFYSVADFLGEPVGLELFARNSIHKYPL